MNVVRHQAIADDREWIELHRLPNQIQIHHAFGVSRENVLPPITTLRYMMSDIDRNHTSQTSHGWTKISENVPSVPGFLKISENVPSVPGFPVPGFQECEVS